MQRGTGGGERRKCVRKSGVGAGTGNVRAVKMLAVFRIGSGNENGEIVAKVSAE